MEGFSRWDDESATGPRQGMKCWSRSGACLRTPSGGDTAIETHPPPCWGISGLCIARLGRSTLGRVSIAHPTLRCARSRNQSSHDRIYLTCTEPWCPTVAAALDGVRLCSHHLGGSGHLYPPRLTESIHGASKFLPHFSALCLLFSPLRPSPHAR